MDDYFKLFADARDLVEKTTAPHLLIAFVEIRTKREAMLHLRRKAVAMAETLAVEVKDKKTVEFAKRVAGFFFCSQLQEPRRMSESERVVVELLDLVGREDIHRAEFLRSLARTQKQLEGSWVAIAQAYAVLRLRALRP